MSVGNISGVKKAISQCIKFSLTISIIASFLLFIFSRFIATTWLHGAISATPFCILSICLPFISVSSSISGYFNSLRQVIKPAIGQIIGQLFRISFVSYLLILFAPKNLDSICISLVLGSTISEILSCFYLYVLYNRSINKITVLPTGAVLIKNNTSSFKKNINNFKSRIFKIAAPIATTSYIRSGLFSLKQILIPIGLAKSGMDYSVAFSNYGVIAGMVMPILLFPSIILNSLNGLLIPEFSAFSYNKYYKNIVRVTKKLLKTTFIFGSFCIIIFLCFAKQFGTVIYNNPNVTHFLTLLCPIVMFTYIDDIVDSILKGLGRQVSVMVFNIIDLFVSITLLYLLLPIYGIYGYVIVIYVSEILNFTISSLALVKAIRVPKNLKKNSSYFVSRFQ